MSSLFFQPDAWLALLTLTCLEIVLGIDNLIFLSLLTARLPTQQQSRARLLGLSLAMLTRLALLSSLNWLMHLTTPLFSLFDHPVSQRDILLIAGGLFLMTKATLEIHHSLEERPENQAADHSARQVTFLGTITQIGVMDILFSLDSVITAIGLVDELPIMMAAIVLAMVVMLLLSKSITGFIDHNPSVKILALSFLIMIAAGLIGDGLGHPIPKGYIYFSMCFSLAVEFLNKQRQSKL